MVNKRNKKSPGKNVDTDSLIGQQVSHGDFLNPTMDGLPATFSREGAQLDQTDIAALLDFFLLLDQWDKQKKIA